MNSVVDYLLNNTVRVCIVAPNFQQINLIKDNILNKIYRSHNDNYIENQNKFYYIKFRNKSQIDFVSSGSDYEKNKIRGIRYDLILFKDCYYINDISYYCTATERGIYVC